MKRPVELVELADVIDRLRASPTIVDGPRTALALETAAAMMRREAARLDERRAHGTATE